MFPTSFDESNLVLARPPEMSAEECDPLSVYRGQTTEGHPVVVSCFKMTPAELEEVKRTGRVWLMVNGNTMPPVRLLGIKPFEE